MDMGHERDEGFKKVDIFLAKIKHQIDKRLKESRYMDDGFGQERIQRLQLLLDKVEAVMRELNLIVWGAEVFKVFPEDLSDEECGN